MFIQKYFTTVIIQKNPREEWLQPRLNQLPLLLTTTVDSGRVAKYSIEGSISAEVVRLHNFYLSITKQASSVIEEGASKKITVIVSEGKELEIRELEGDLL